MPEDSTASDPVAVDVTADDDAEVEQQDENRDQKPSPIVRKPSPFPRRTAASVPETADTAEDAGEDVEGERQEDGDGEEPSPAPDDRVPRGRALAITVAVSVVVVVVLAAAGGVLWYLRAEHDNRQRDAAITLAARNEVLALLTLSPDNGQESLDRALAGATGGWRQEFADKADQFIQVVRNGKVRSQATISASAIQNADDDRATVLVSANAMIQNSDSPQGYPGVYRVLMVLERQDATWLVSDLQFVA